MAGIAGALRALLLTGLVIAVAFTNAAFLRAHWDLDNIGTSRRYWEDLTVAFSLHETRDWGPTPSQSIDGAAASHIYNRLRELLPKAEEREMLRPWEFWRTVRFRGFVDIAPFELRFSDDTGRARLSAWAFASLGGVAPYLPIWLPFLFFVPVAFWVVVEGLRCREAPAVVLFLVLLSSSPYFLEALTLPYSAVGFHLLAGLTLVPLTFFALGPPPTRSGVWLRVVAATTMIHIATLCRSSCVIFLPFAAVLLLIALFRSEAALPLRRRLLLAFLLLCVVAAPRALAPKQAHEMWVGMWEGLGDFDRAYGHEWSDPAARRALDREGYVMQKRGPYWTPESEAIFRRLVLEHIRTDPAWYVSILGRRVLATVTQARLWPTVRETGMSYRPAKHPGEGFVETYYNFVTTADGFTFFGRRWEAPLWVFWAAAIAFLLNTLLNARQEAPRRRIAVFSVFALSALLLPVAVTTLSGIETQFIMVGYLLCASFVICDATLGAYRRLHQTSVHSGVEGTTP